MSNKDKEKLEPWEEELRNSILRGPKTSVRILNEEGVNLVKKIFDVVSMAVDYDDGVTVDWNITTQLSVMGAVEVNGRLVTIGDPQLFQLAVLAADNLEVYPKTDGTVQLSLTFRNMTIRIQEEKK